MSLLPACIDENRDDCRHGLEISFYSRTPCQDSPAYPASVKDILLCVFDADDILIGHRYLQNVSLGSGYSERWELDPGIYSVTAWSGISEEYFAVFPPVDGTTRKEDVFFRIERIAGNALSIDGVQIYFGASSRVSLEASDSGDSYVEVSVNMLEVTNRVSVTVEGLEEQAARYDVRITSDNGSMNLDGTLAPDSDIVYVPTALTQAENRWDFTLLKLETGREYTVTVTDATDGNLLYTGDLLEDLILMNPNLNLSCDHDFEVTFTVDDRSGTYVLTIIKVNGWIVHSYSTEF